MTRRNPFKLYNKQHKHFERVFTFSRCGVKFFYDLALQETGRGGSGNAEQGLHLQSGLVLHFEGILLTVEAVIARVQPHHLVPPPFQRSNVEGFQWFRRQICQLIHCPAHIFLAGNTYTYLNKAGIEVINFKSL